MAKATVICLIGERRDDVPAHTAIPLAFQRISAELDDHSFFVATLFQPERAGLNNRPTPLVEVFVRAAESTRAALDRLEACRSLFHPGNPCPGSSSLA